LPHNFKYPTIDAIKEFNRVIVADRNESYSVEDPERLERILQDIKTIGEELHLEQAIIKKAARLLHGITQVQPFYDGNKETALAATSVFLTHNGYNLKATNEEIFTRLTGIINGSEDLNSIEQFLLLHVRKI